MFDVEFKMSLLPKLVMCTSSNSSKANMATNRLSHFRIISEIPNFVWSTSNKTRYDIIQDVSRQSLTVVYITMMCAPLDELVASAYMTIFASR